MVEEEREGRGAEAARTELEVFFLVGGEEVEKKDKEKKIKPGERGEKVRLNRPLFQIHRGALAAPFRSDAIACDVNHVLIWNCGSSKQRPERRTGAAAS